MNNRTLTFNNGIQIALKAITMNTEEVKIINSDSQIIQNHFIRKMKTIDSQFSCAFKGVGFSGSFHDGNKIHMPPSYNIHVKMDLSCGLQPISVRGQPNYVYLRVVGGNTSHKCLDTFGGRDLYVNFKKLYAWYRENIIAALPDLQAIPCGGGRVYRLNYRAQGQNTAHTIVATEHHYGGRQIYFDFVPIFEFAPSKWPKDMPRCGINGIWYTFPSGYNNRSTASFMVCVPRWDGLLLYKKINFLDSLRRMVALCRAKNMPGFLSFILKCHYLNELENKSINWDQNPGRILIRMLVNLVQRLCDGILPFYLNSDHNCLETLNRKTQKKYLHIIRTTLNKLIRCRDNNFYDINDVYTIFGIEIESN